MGRPVTCLFHSLDNVIVYPNRARLDGQLQDVRNIEVVEQAAGGITVSLVLLGNLCEPTWIEVLAQVFSVVVPSYRTQHLSLKCLQNHVERQLQQMMVQIGVMDIARNLSMTQDEGKLAIF